MVVDDEDRENEGDFITAAAYMTPGGDQFYEQTWPGPDLRAPAGRTLR